MYSQDIIGNVYYGIQFDKKVLYQTSLEEAICSEN